LAACGSKSDSTPAATTAAAPIDDKALDKAAEGYRTYVQGQSKVLLDRTGPFVAAVKAGDVAKAKQLFAAARFPYEAIEPVAESFGNLDPEIDARVNDVAKGDDWTGFHRIEKALWTDKSTTGMSPIADKLLVDVKQLDAKVATATYRPDQLANGASELLGEVSKSKITGEEDRYSHTDLSDFDANLAGSQAAYDLLAPALAKRDATLATTISARFAAVRKELEATKKGGEYPSYTTVDTAQRRKFSQLVDALAEPLSQVAAKLKS
ncbi:MAG TPA: iron uptake system protein EfeO, partial [Solirubrobacteraceae bacterium]|nr:iron uptake system protein EfeO [Solirubrobacteraceae bacterium]